ncbi:MAG: ABC transporter ATP-binding protein/permease [Ruminococcus sp.]|nr:ABC transporter ATP-binding protein/permease [Ruminococcus sp.]
MIKKRLIQEMGDSKKYIFGNVAAQWVSLASNIVMIFGIANLLDKMINKSAGNSDYAFAITAAVCSLVIRFVCSRLQEKCSYLSSKSVKKKLRELIFRKLLRLGTSYRESVPTSEIVQLSVEGVDQLETYYGQFLSQFFYAFLAPLTLFAVLSFVSVKSAVVLLICVPLIPGAIMMVQKIAKKLLGKYWGQYAALGDTFLENLQGLTTLKIYQADEHTTKKMQQESEHFRRITMKVLTMQLNSVTIMDLIAYGGAALGVVLAAGEYNKGHIGFAGCFAIILLSADFFIPMRKLGSFFHVAMNGMAASDRLFKILDLPEPEQKIETISAENRTIKISDLRYSYDESREVLHGVDIDIPMHGLTAICGESGCGKSTVAGILMGRNKGYSGSVKIGENELSDISDSSLMESITYISHNSYLFKGTVRENLQTGNFRADDDEMWAALERTKLADFLRSESGLDTLLTENGGNLSGGQRQRLALARALLHDTPIYIFDEATSSVDADSETDIIDMIYELAQTKTVIMISHRLANSVGAMKIFALEKGSLAECGTHEDLLADGGIYAKMWQTQQALENIGKGAEK